MATENVFGVLLTDQAWVDLAEALKPYSSTGPIGQYIYCKNVFHDGPYFVMVTKCSNNDDSTFEAQISIPHYYVKFFVSAPDKSKIGFLQE
jgi:hypothetical protein